MRWLLTMAIVITVVMLAGCRGDSDEESPAATVVATATGESGLDAARRAEADDDPSLPGEFVDLQAIYGGSYGATEGTNTGRHVTRDMDYETEQGLPPAGGPHWGSSACGNDPAAAPPLCGPAPWGVYRAPWQPETLVHNMEHAGVIIWYNTSDRDVIDELEAFAIDQLETPGGINLVLAPYPDMADETVAITTWSRRDMFPAAELDTDRLQAFLDAHYCRFDAESFC